MSLLDERPAATSSPRGRRKSDAVAVSLPDWLDAPLLPCEAPRDGDLIDAPLAEPGDYLFEFHESTGTASWLRIHAVAVVDGAALVTCGRVPGVTLPVPADRQVWVLRRADAETLVHAVSDRVLRPWGGPEQEMESLLRRFASVDALIKGWPYGESSLADALTAWDLLRVSDLANRAALPLTSREGVSA